MEATVASNRKVSVVTRRFMAIASFDDGRQFAQQGSQTLLGLVHVKTFHDLPGLRDIGMDDGNLQILLERLDDSFRSPGPALDVNAIGAAALEKQLLHMRVTFFRRDLPGLVER